MPNSSHLLLLCLKFEVLLKMRGLASLALGLISQLSILAAELRRLLQILEYRSYMIFPVNLHIVLLGRLFHKLHFFPALTESCTGRFHGALRLPLRLALKLQIQSAFQVLRVVCFEQLLLLCCLYSL